MYVAMVHTCPAFSLALGYGEKLRNSRRSRVEKVGKATVRILEGNDRGKRNECFGGKMVASGGQSWPVWALKFFATAAVLGLDFCQSRGAVCRGGR